MSPLPEPIERLALYFSGEQSRQGILARAALGRAAPGDPELARRLAHDAGDALRPDGSLRGAALPTIWRAHELLDLGAPPDREPLRSTLQWILQLQGKPGAYGEGCDRERHNRRLCGHYLEGFFAPAAPTERLTPITLPNGKVYRAEPAARFAISCLALRVLLRGGLGDRPGVRRHVHILAALAERWTAWDSSFPPDLMAAATQALALAGAERRELVSRLATLAAANQAPEGGWAAADFFNALEALLAAETEEARTAVRRAVPALIARQRPDGTFGSMAMQERALLGLRAMLRAEGGR